MPDAPNPLAEKLRRRIARDGPLSIADYMEICLADPDYGYYRTRDPLGAKGDFITAPEISQIFGELIGLWCAEIWRGMGSPVAFRMVELGPGRGTLMADALRAGGTVPAFADAAELHLVETSPVLRRLQKDRLAGYRPQWHGALDEVADGPLILVANEFLDALPVRQYVRRRGGWLERRVDCAPRGGFAWCEDAGHLAGNALIPDAVSATAGDGDIAEVRPAVDTLVAELAGRARTFPVTALFIDYGHRASAPGDTFQAVAAHGYADPLEEPGRHDLTAHVDFAALARAASDAGLAVYGPVEQETFLLELGLAQRCKTLMKGTDKERARMIESGARRLADPAQMGSLFKAVALCGGEAGIPPPFEAAKPETQPGTEP